MQYEVLCNIGVEVNCSIVALAVYGPLPRTCAGQRSEQILADEGSKQTRQSCCPLVLVASVLPNN